MARAKPVKTRKSSTRAPASPQIRISFKKSIAMGPGKADLLDAIVATGSISAAGRKMNMSYRRAWLLVETMNTCFREPLVETLVGGQHGGGARVTPLGEEVVRRFRQMEAKAARSVAEEMAAFAALMATVST